MRVAQRAARPLRSSPEDRRERDTIMERRSTGFTPLSHAKEPQKEFLVDNGLGDSTAGSFHLHRKNITTHARKQEVQDETSMLTGLEKLDLTTRLTSSRPSKLELATALLDASDRANPLKYAA